MMKTRTRNDVRISDLLKRLTVSICLMGASAFTVAETVHPAKLSSTDLTGKAFDNPNTMPKHQPATFSTSPMKSSDGKFARHVRGG